MAQIVVCAAQSVVRAGLVAIAQSTTPETVVQAHNLQSLNQQLKTHPIDLAVIELAQQDAKVLEALCKLLEDEVKDTFATVESLFVLLLVETVDGLSAIAQKTLSQLVSTGRVSLLPVNASADELQSAIATILNGYIVLYPDFAETLFNSPDDSLNVASATDSDQEVLTTREVQVLNQLVDGLSNRAIAQALNISEHTVKFHISAILSKLGVSSRTEAVAVGIRSGLVML